MPGILTEIASAIDGKESTFVQNVVGTYSIVPANPRRYSLIVSNPAAAIALISTSPNNLPAFGITVNPGQTLVMDVRNWGNLPMKEWFTAVTGAAISLSIFQVLFTEDK